MRYNARRYERVMREVYVEAESPMQALEKILDNADGVMWHSETNHDRVAVEVDFHDNDGVGSTLHYQG